MSDNTLYELMSEIRDLINRPRKQHILLQDNALWSKLCDSMDAVEDTEKVLTDYLKEDLDSSYKGLQICNVLDTLAHQQGAVDSLHEALNIPYTKNPLLEKIRRICIDAIENSTNKRDEDAFNSVNILDLITTQSDILRKFLSALIKTLRKEELNHRKKFAGKRLSSAFGITSYPFQKIFEAVLSKNSPHISLVGVHVDQILGSIGEFKAGLKEREEPDDNISDIYENLNYSLQNIKAYFRDSSTTHIHEKDLYIFTDFALRQVKELQEIALQIDEMYSQYSIYT